MGESEGGLERQREGGGDVTERKREGRRKSEGRREGVRGTTMGWEGRGSDRQKEEGGGVRKGRGG